MATAAPDSADEWADECADEWAAPVSRWNRFDIRSVDDLQTSVHGSRPDCGWEAVQFSPGRLAGSVVHGACRGVAMTCSRIEGTYALRGILSAGGISVSVALRMASTSRQWLGEIGTGTSMIVQPGDEIDSCNNDRSFYLTSVTTVDRLLAEAALEGVVIPDFHLGSSGVLKREIDPGKLDVMTSLLGALHAGQDLMLLPGARAEDMILSILVDHLGEEPAAVGMADPAAGYPRIVARARAFIDSRLEQPISIDEIAAAAFASRRTLHRAFGEILGESPQSYVLKLRLNRIRRDLASPGEAERTVTMVSLRWGIGEMGRLAGRYREQFGELPSQTLARRRGGQGAAATV